MRLSQVRLLVSDFDGCFRFYRDVMGLPVGFGKEGDGYADFEIDGQQLIALFKRDLMAAAIGTLNEGDASGGRDRVNICLAVPDVDAAVRELEGRGATFLMPPTDQPPWGLRVAYLRDPDGTLIEIQHPIPMADAPQTGSVTGAVG